LLDATRGKLLEGEQLAGLVPLADLLGSLEVHVAVDHRSVLDEECCVRVPPRASFSDHGR